MKHLKHFLEEMIENPPREISNGCGDKTLALTQEQRKGFKLACIIIQSMIEQGLTFETKSNTEA